MEQLSTIFVSTFQYGTVSINSRLSHLPFLIPEYNDATSSHCLSVKSLGYDFPFMCTLHRSKAKVSAFSAIP